MHAQSSGATARTPARVTALLMGVLGTLAVAAAEPSLDVTITVDAARAGAPLAPIWRYFGADEPNYATMKDGRRLLAKLGELKPGAVYFRAHNLLTSGDGTPALKWGSTNAYTEDSQGDAVYDWRILDRIFDTYLERGVKPLVEIGFMPQALSSAPASVPYQHEWRPGTGDLSGGWNYPPRDYERWSQLCFEWVKHLIGRYGRAEVETWLFETWNEANLSVYWHGTPEEFQKLHDYAIAGIRRALPTARVGGPDVAGSGGQFMQDFLTHVTEGRNFATGERGTPTDFVSFHAKGSPAFVDGHVQMGIAAQLTTIDEGFAMIAARPALRDKPIIIGESDPEGCAACRGASVGYRNGTMYSSYTAATFARKYDLAARHGVNLEGALTWAFEFEDQPYFAGFRQLNSNGLDLPVMNVFRMFSRMQGQRLAAQSSAQIPLDEIMHSGVRQAPDVGVLASGNANHIAVLIWHYHDDDLPGPDAAVDLKLSGMKAWRGARVTHYRIDEQHSNSYAAWQRMGSPVAPTRAQYDELREAGQLQTLAPPASLPIRKGTAQIDFTLPRQGVSLLIVEPN